MSKPRRSSASTKLSAVTASAVALIGTLGATTPVAASPSLPRKATIVLVHGAFADASAWQAVIPKLQKAGHKVVGVQSPLRTFEEDVATTKRVIDAQTGPVIAVGHSYGGAVITGAAADNPNVKGLVFVAALAPDANEKIATLYEKDGKPELLSALVPDAAGFLSIDPARFRELFAADVSAERAAVMAATQKPIAGKNFEGSVTRAAWKTIPSWYVLAQDDRAIPAALQSYIAKRMGARVTTVKASHVPFASKPNEVAKVILEAAGGASQ
ncbi:MAG TPA: alpha/beta hydrolase [Polyangia bacterium]